jgi:FkbM family methyltransferase
LYKRYTRALYSLLPSLYRTKLRFESRVRRRLGLPTERDHRLFRCFAEASDAVFVDVGSNVGQTIDAVRMHGWNCTIHAFEPNPLLCERLGAEYRDDHRLTTHCVALADQAGVLALTVPVYRGLPFHGNASLDADCARRWMSRDNIFAFNPNYLRMETFQVEVTTLDAMDLAPFFVKVDVEGGELKVLRGARKTIDRARPLLMLEGAGQAGEEAFLADLGYRPFRFDGHALRPGLAGGLNAFFLPEERVGDIPIAVKVQ